MSIKASTDSTYNLVSTANISQKWDPLVRAQGPMTSAKHPYYDVTHKKIQPFPIFLF